MGASCSAGCFNQLWHGASQSGAKGSRAPAEVLVIGAGLAGLACALRLQEQGLRVKVLEARPLVGGRASRGGADWVHGQHVTTWRYLKRFNMQTDGSANGWDLNTPGGAECWVYVDGKLRGPEEVHREPNRLFFAKFEELVQEWIEAGREDVSMATLADRAFDQPPTADERRLMEGMMAEWHAADLADVGVYEDDLYSERIQSLARSRPSLLAEDGDEGHWKIVGGHQGLAEKMAKALDLSLSTVVEQVNWAGDKVSVLCRGGLSFTARAAVVTIPIACIPDLNFDPQLPEEKKLAVNQLGRGVTTTVYLHFKESFWPERMAFLFHSMSSQVFWPGRNRRVLTAYFGGHEANKHLLSMSDADMTAEILRQLGVIFKRRVEELFLKSEVHRWDTDPFAKMAYSYCPVGTAQLRSALGAPCGNLFWAGEASHPTKGSFAHGALEEGERAADEVLAFLR